MVTITATNSATATLPSVLLKTRLDQARREADQAEANARDLQAKADAAENQAQQSRGRVQDLSSRRQPPDATKKPQTADSKPEPARDIQEISVSLYQAAGPSGTTSVNALKLTFHTGTVFNSMGQATGRIVNLSV